MGQNQNDTTNTSNSEKTKVRGDPNPTIVENWNATQFGDGGYDLSQRD